MTTRRDSLLCPQPEPTETGLGVLCDIDAAYVPGLLPLLESRKYTTAWENGQVYGQGARYYTKLQWELLMDASVLIRREIRQVRGPLVGSELVDVDPLVTADYPGVALRDILYNDVSGLEGINEKLQILVDQAAAENQEEQLEALQQIILLLGGAI